MQIRRCETLDEAMKGPMIEVRDGGNGSYMLSRALTQDGSLLSGPFPSVATAEQAGIDEATRLNIEVLNIVHTRG